VKPAEHWQRHESGDVWNPARPDLHGSFPPATRAYDPPKYEPISPHFSVSTVGEVAISEPFVLAYNPHRTKCYVDTREDRWTPRERQLANARARDVPTSVPVAIRRHDMTLRDWLLSTGQIVPASEERL
jgi:hypothetical protein